MQELITKLTQQLNVNDKQARGGAAILLKAAKDKLGGAEFGKLLGSVPGVDALIRQAPASGGGLLGGLASLAGGNAALIATVVSGFSQLNLSSDDAQRFVPVMLDYLRGQVGPEAVSKLEKTLRA